MQRRLFAGLPVVVEHPAGSIRYWYDRDSREIGSTKMHNDYGFLEGHMGPDGDEVDVYLGPNEQAKDVHVVHQLRTPKYERWDEDKAMIGFDSTDAARSAYIAHRNDGDRAIQGISSMPLERFKEKLERRTGTGKVRHEIVGDLILFEALRDPNGKVRTGVWDYVCVEGEDRKPEGDQVSRTAFNPSTLSQMIDNFVARGDVIPIDYNHQSNYAKVNGQPAPALGFYSQLALVWNGKVQKIGTAANHEPATGMEPGLDSSKNGLWAFRCEVTEIGENLLPSFKYLSPTFTPQGMNRAGQNVGYVLAAVAATNTPWQSGTEINFDREPGETAATKGDTTMAKKLGKLAKFAKMADDSEDKDIKQALFTRMAVDSQKAMDGEEGFNYEEEAAKLEEAAKSYEDAQMEEEGGEPPQTVMRKLAAGYRKMKKLGDPPFGGKETPSEEAAEAKAKMAKMEEEAKMAKLEGKEDEKALATMAQQLGLPQGASAQQIAVAMEAKTVGLDKLGALEKQVAELRAAREADVKAERKNSALLAFEQATSQGRTKAEKRDAFVSAYERSPKEAEALLFEAGTFPATVVLFDRMTTPGGATLGVGDRPAPGGSSGGKDRKAYETPIGTFVVDGEEFSKMACEMADAKDGAIKMEIDAKLEEHERSDPASRLIVAQQLLKKKRPDMWDAAERNY